MVFLLGELSEVGTWIGWPLVGLVLGLFCLPPLWRAIDRAKSIKFKPIEGTFEVDLDPQVVHNFEDTIEKTIASDPQEDTARQPY